MYWHERRSKKNSKKNDFEKYFFLMVNRVIFGKTMKLVRKHGDINLIAAENLVSEPNYRNLKFFTEHLLAIEMRKRR